MREQPQVPIPEKFQSPFVFPEANSGSGAPPPKVSRGFNRRIRHAVNVLFGGMLVAVVCVAVLLAVAWIQSQGAVDVAKAQANALREGNVEKAYQFFSTEYRAGMSLPSFRRWLARENHLANNHGLNIWGRSLHGGTAVLWGSLQDDLGRDYPVRYELVRESGNWRVDDLQVQPPASDSLPETIPFQHI